MLDTIAMLGAMPARYGHTGGKVSLDLYFAMARGRQDAPAGPFFFGDFRFGTG